MICSCNVCVCVDIVVCLCIDMHMVIYVSQNVVSNSVSDSCALAELVGKKIFSIVINAVSFSFCQIPSFLYGTLCLLYGL